MRGLRHLSLLGTRVTDAGLADLAGLRDLTVPDLRDCPGVTAAGLKSLARRKGLKEVRLGRTAVTEEGAAQLRKALPGCRVVN